MRSLVLAAILAGSCAAGARADCVADFNAVIKHGAEAGPFRVEDTVDTGEMTVVTTTQRVPPGAVHAKVASPKQNQEVILIDGTGWANVKGLWIKLPEDTAKQLFTDIVGKGLMNSSGARNIACFGHKTVEGKDYLVFTYDAGISNFTVPMTLYADPATNLPVRGEGSIDNAGKNAKFTTVYTADPSLRIEQPPTP